MYDNIKIIQYIENIKELDVLQVKQRFSMYNENVEKEEGLCLLEPSCTPFGNISRQKEI